jgi:hypothetical protein
MKARLREAGTFDWRVTMKARASGTKTQEKFRKDVARHTKTPLPCFFVSVDSEQLKVLCFHTLLEVFILNGLRMKLLCVLGAYGTSG